MPHVIVLGGPNGAGKSTTAPGLLHDYLGLDDFVDADEIARGLAAFAPETVAREAGRIMLMRLRELAAGRRDFAFETTLASRSFAPWLAGLRRSGYQINLFYLWVPTPELCLRRVAERVRLGGHNVPEAEIRRRYTRGLLNLFSLYLPIADHWKVFDSSGGPRRLIVESQLNAPARVYDERVWSTMRRAGGALP